MNSFYPATAIILAEICVALLVMNGSMLFMIIRNKRRTRRALTQLTERLKQNESDRLVSLKTILKDICHYSEDRINEASAGLIKTELAFYQALMNAVSSGNTESLEDLGLKTHSLIDSYSNIVPQTGASAGDNTQMQGADGAVSELKTEMAQLRHENERLSTEMNAIKAEMDETNSEFTRTFTKGGNEETDTTQSDDQTTAEDVGVQDTETAEAQTAPAQPPEEISTESAVASEGHAATLKEKEGKDDQINASVDTAASRKDASLHNEPTINVDNEAHEDDDDILDKSDIKLEEINPDEDNNAADKNGMVSDGSPDPESGTRPGDNATQNTSVDKAEKEASDHPVAKNTQDKEKTASVKAETV